MYHIDSKVDRPDHKYLLERMRRNMAEGIMTNDLGQLKFFMEEKIKLQEMMFDGKYSLANPRSPKQIGAYLSMLNDPKVYSAAYDARKNKWTTDKNVLRTLSEQGYQFASEILKYRALDATRKALQSIQDSQDRLTGLISPEVNVGKTGRLQYSKPGMLSIPKNLLYDVIIPRKKGDVLISVDIKNQEPSILINWLGIEELKPALNHPDGLYEYIFKKTFKATVSCTMHVGNWNTEEMTYASLLEDERISKEYYEPRKPLLASTHYEGKRIDKIAVPNFQVRVRSMGVALPEVVAVKFEDGTVKPMAVVWDKLDPDSISKQGIYEHHGYLKDVTVECVDEVRSEFKTSWNAITYGSSAWGVKQYCKNIDGQIIYDYMMGISQFKSIRTKAKKQANNYDTFTTTFFGTQLDVAADGEEDPKAIERRLLDYPIQGTGSDILSLLVKHFDSEREKRNIADKLDLYYTRHDELVLIANGEWFEQEGEDKILQVVSDLFIHQIDDWTPFKVTIKVIKPQGLDALIDTLLTDVDDE